MSNKYILDGNHKPIRCDNILEWGSWFEKADRTVTKTQIGEILVSTVFLSINHNFGEGEPILFKTMVFGGSHDGEMERYSTWDEAVKGHERMVKKVNNADN